MKRSTFSEEQIVYAIQQADAGTPVGDLCRQLGVRDATFYAWKKKGAYLGVSELRRLRQLEEENSRLKRLFADLSLDKHMRSGHSHTDGLAFKRATVYTPDHARMVKHTKDFAALEKGLACAKSFYSVPS
jgi:putative transposase